MYIKFITEGFLQDELSEKLQNDFGFEIEFEMEENGNFEYFFGESEDGLEQGKEDPLPFLEAIRCCGVLYRNGIYNFAIEGNGPWAMSMIQGTDFRGYAVDDAQKRSWAKRATLFWREADPSQVANIIPSVE